MDHKGQAQSRTAWQYRTAPKFREWINVLPALAQTEIEDPAQRIADVLDIDGSTGVMLDIVGRIVGIGREYKEEVDQDVVEIGTGQCGDDMTMCSATSESIEQDASDALYRILLKARIARNNGDATINDIVQGVKFIASVDGVRVQDWQDMTFNITFEEVLPTVERAMLTAFDIVPRPQGVKYLGFSEEPLTTQVGSGQCASDGDSCNPMYYGS